MIRIVRTDSENRDFIELVSRLDADLAERDGEDHSFYAQFNKIDRIQYVVVAYENVNDPAKNAFWKQVKGNRRQWDYTKSMDTRSYRIMRNMLTLKTVYVLKNN